MKTSFYSRIRRNEGGVDLRMDRLAFKRLLRGLWVVLATSILLLAIYLLLPLLYPPARLVARLYHASTSVDS